jgi:hypothetical protein
VSPARLPCQAFSKEQDKARSEYDKYRVRLAEFEGKPDKADKYNEVSTPSTP